MPLSGQVKQTKPGLAFGAGLALYIFMNSGIAGIAFEVIGIVVEVIAGIAYEVIGIALK